MRGNDIALVRHAQLGERLRTLLHGGPIRCRPHEHAHACAINGYDFRHRLSGSLPGSFRATQDTVHQGAPAGAMMLGPRHPMGIGVTVARLTLNQLVKVRILDPQLEAQPARANSPGPVVFFDQRRVSCRPIHGHGPRPGHAASRVPSRPFHGPPSWMPPPSP